MSLTALNTVNSCLSTGIGGNGAQFVRMSQGCYQLRHNVNGSIDEP